MKIVLLKSCRFRRRGFDETWRVKLSEPLPGRDHQSLNVFRTQLENLRKMFLQRQNPLKRETPGPTDLQPVLECSDGNEISNKFVECVLRQQTRRALPDPQNHEQKLLLKPVS